MQGQRVQPVTINGESDTLTRVENSAKSSKIYTELSCSKIEQLGFLSVHVNTELAY